MAGAVLEKKIERAPPGAYEHLDQLESFDHEKACAIVSVITQFCCGGQHVDGTVAGRNAFKRLPMTWVAVNLPKVIKQSIDLEDN